MQERIGQTPPPKIKLFEGKAPPTAWVDENIVKYCQLESQMALLRDVVTYVQQLQSQQLSQARVKPLLIKANLLAIPDKGGAKDVGNVAAYNGTQNCLKLEMEYLENLILLLQQGNPKLAGELDRMLSQLKKMGQDFPHLSKQQIEDLNGMEKQLLAHVQQMPYSYQRLFWNMQLNLLQNLMSENGSNIKDLHNEMKELSARNQMLSELQELLQKIQNGLKAKPPSQEQFLELIENLQNLANKYPNLNPDQSQALSSFFSQLEGFKTSKGKNINQIIADALLETKLSDFLKANPQATPEQVRAFLQNFLKQSNLQNSNLPFMKSLGDALEEVLGKKGFPACTGYAGSEFASLHDGKLRPNESLFPDLLAEYAADPKSVNALEKSTQTLSKAAEEEITDNHHKIDGYQTAASQLSEIQNHFGRAALWTVGQSMNAGNPPKGAKPSHFRLTAAAAPAAAAPAAGGTNQSLPSQFQNAILNHYMPGQEKYLEALAEVLFLLNDGSEFGNKLLTDLMGYDGAADEFNFNTQLHSSNGDFSGSVTWATQQLKNEQNNCSTAINDVTKTINDSQTKLDTINIELKNKNLTPDQRNILLDQQSKLQSLVDNGKQSLLQLGKLRTALNAIQIGPPIGTDPTHQDPTKYFHVYGAGGKPNPGPPPTPAPPDGWQSAIGNTEQFVIKGDPSNKDAPGGLINLHQQADGFQKAYADQGQNQQMLLQMRMTEIQQEWTVVATALQLLNQMYMTLAQAIYGK